MFDYLPFGSFRVSLMSQAIFKYQDSVMKAK